MTALADLSQRAELPTAGIADEAITTPLSAFDTQYECGASEAYSANFTAFPHTVLASAGNPLAIEYTPTVDAYWEIDATIGLVEKMDTAIHYVYGQIAVTPAPVAGLSSARMAIHGQKADVIWARWQRSVNTLVMLAAGITYTANVLLSSGNGGTWRYFMGANYMQVHGKGWAR